MAVTQQRIEDMELTLNRGEQVVGMSGLGRFPGIGVCDKALVFGMLLCMLQVFDGILTSVGVSRFGTAIEGNPFIRALMEEWGYVTALGFVKVAAILIVVGLTFFARRIPWINNAMGAISCVYIFAAIIPWTYILFVKPLLG